MNVHSAGSAAMSHLHVSAQAKPAATAAADSAASQKSSEANANAAPKAAQPGTTVSISNAAKAALAEASETPAQTEQEARGNDMQAKRLVAREAAAKAAAQ